MKICFEEYFNKKFIVVFLKSFASFILFAKKFNDDLKFCVNFRKLNKITKKISLFYFFITDFMTRLFKIKFF